MAQIVERQTLGFSSKDASSQIKGLLWQLQGTKPSSPRGIVQIVHGMTEYVGRYDAFARFLASEGYVVCGHDHIGHGKSVSDSADWGHMPVEGGREALVEDVGQLRSLVSARYARSVPYFIFGHSMGSLILRNYLAGHGEGLAGAVICGTANKPVAVSRLGNFLARYLAKRKGERYVSSFLHSMADGAYSKAIPNPRTPFDWLSVNEANVDAFIADEACGFPFTVGAYAALTSLSADAARVDLAVRVPHDLPLLFIAGENDPVGASGKGVYAAADVMRMAGVSSIDVILYEGMRHEILNEAESGKVYADVLAWLEKHRVKSC